MKISKILAMVLMATIYQNSEAQAGIFDKIKSVFGKGDNSAKLAQLEEAEKKIAYLSEPQLCIRKVFER